MGPDLHGQMGGKGVNMHLSPGLSSQHGGGAAQVQPGQQNGERGGQEGPGRNASWEVRPWPKCVAGGRGGPGQNGLLT